MAELKGKQIVTFLNIFQNYSCLWDVSSKDYLHRYVKEVSYNTLLECRLINYLRGPTDDTFALTKRLKTRE